MSFFISRAVAAAGGGKPMQDRADIFARGDAAVLVVADGAGGLGDGAAAADKVLDLVRTAVLDPGFDLLVPASWIRLLGDSDEEIARVGETTAVVVVLVPGMLVYASAGDSEAWIVRADDEVRLTKHSARLGSGRPSIRASARGELDGRLLVASDGLFRHVAAEAIRATMRQERFGAVGDALIALGGPTRADDMAILVAEKA